MGEPSVLERDYISMAHLVFGSGTQYGLVSSANLDRPTGSFWYLVTARNKIPVLGYDHGAEVEASAHQSRDCIRDTEGVKNPLFCVAAREVERRIMGRHMVVAQMA